MKVYSTWLVFIVAWLAERLGQVDAAIPLPQPRLEHLLLR